MDTYTYTYIYTLSVTHTHTHTHAHIHTPASAHLASRYCRSHPHTLSHTHAHKTKQTHRWFYLFLFRSFFQMPFIYFCFAHFFKCRHSPSSRLSSLPLQFTPPRLGLNVPSHQTKQTGNNKRNCNTRCPTPIPLPTCFPPTHPSFSIQLICSGSTSYQHPCPSGPWSVPSRSAYDL